MNKKNSIIIVVLIFLSIVPFLFAFYYNFKDQSISNNISDWASFGDYIGGILNTFLSLLILIATIYIAYQLNKFDEARNEKIIEFEKDKLLREFREIEYKTISNELNKLWEIVTNPDRNYGMCELFIVYNRYSDFLKYKNHLFPNLNEKEFTDLQFFIRNAHTYYCENEIIYLEKIPQFDKMSQLIDTFHLKLQLFLMDN